MFVLVFFVNYTADEGKKLTYLSVVLKKCRNCLYGHIISVNIKHVVLIVVLVATE